MQSDPGWSELLNRVRHGTTTDQDLAELHKLVLNDENTPDFGSGEWSDATLVTARHAVRTRWNDAALRKSCQDNGHPLVRIVANDTINGRTLTPVQRELVRLNEEKRKKRVEKQGEKSVLPQEVELAIGAKVVITENVCPKYHLVNGARGVITDIVLDPQDSGLNATGSVVSPTHLPLFVVVRLNDVRRELRSVPMFEGLGIREVPVFPVERQMRILEPVGPNRPSASRTVVRRQIPLIPAYGLTDYRSQGQTIDKLLLDLKSPPGTHSLSPFNLYVALSRSHGRDDIRILREFEDAPFRSQPDPDLVAEDKRLEYLDEQTQEWWMKMGRKRSR